MLFVPSTEGVDEHSLSWAQAVSWSVSVSTRRASESPLCICALVAALRWRNCCTLVTPVLMRVVAALDFFKEWRRSVLDFQRQRCLQLLVHIISRLPLCVCVCVCFKCIYQVAFILPGQQNVLLLVWWLRRWLYHAKKRMSPSTSRPSEFMLVLVAYLSVVYAVF